MIAIDRRVLVTLVFLALASNLTLLQLTQHPSPTVPLAGLAPSIAGLLGQAGTASYGPRITPVLGVIRVLVLAVAFPDVKPTLSIDGIKREWFGTVLPIIMKSPMES